MGLMACGPRETELPFETIEQYHRSEGYDSPEPCLVLITSQQEIDRLESLVSRGALEQLAELDFQQYFAIAVFRGVRPTSGYDIIIERIARRGDKIVVYAQFWEPRLDQVILPEVTSPYHLIKVRRGDGVSQETELVFQSQIVTSTPPSR